MSLISRIRGLLAAGEEAAPELNDPVLGRMTWSADDEAWTGVYGGHRFSLGYDRKREPAPEVVEFARATLDHPGWVLASFMEAKEGARRDFGALYAEEIDGLALGEMHFFGRRGEMCILADLEGGRDYRCWRIEFTGRRCDGIGFDD
jgi:hypothetical protein